MPIRSSLTNTLPSFLCLCEQVCVLKNTGLILPTVGGEVLHTREVGQEARVHLGDLGVRSLGLGKPSSPSVKWRPLGVTGETKGRRVRRGTPAAGLALNHGDRLPRPGGVQSVTRDSLHVCSFVLCTLFGAVVLC